METTSIKLNEEPKGKEKRVNANTNVAKGNETLENSQEESIENDSSQKVSPKHDRRGVARTMAASAVGAALGSGFTMAVDGEDGGNQTPDAPTPTEPKQEPEVTPKPRSESQSNSKPIEDEPVKKTTIDELVDERKIESEADPNQQDGPLPEQDSPHIEEILVDPEDLDGDLVMNIQGTGTIEVEGSEVNAALVTDDEGNTYFLVDVDGEVNDPNATYDIVVDAETAEVVELPATITVADAELAVNSDPTYIAPTNDDSNNVSVAEMKNDILDPSEPFDAPSMDSTCDDPEFESDLLVENGTDLSSEITYEP